MSILCDLCYQSFFCRFSVVGVLEHLNISVAALEAYMPGI